MALLRFLGVGGGRFVTISQPVGTAGWVLEMDGEVIQIDPGPGTLVRAKQHGFDPKRLTGIVVSHGHPDHCTDAEVVIEAMTLGAKRKRGFLLSNKDVISGTEREPQRISPYHLSLPEITKEIAPEETFNTGKISITAVRTKHRDENALGFVFKGKETIGYTGDGEYYSGQEKSFRDCDILVLNCLRPRDDPWPNHMNAAQAKTLIEKTTPRLAVLQHFGMKMLFGRAEREAEWIEKETGIKTLAARDGMVIDTEKPSGLGRFIQ